MRHLSEEHKRKIREIRMGTHRSEETRKRLSESHKGIIQSKETIEKRILKNTGKKRTEEQKRRMSEANKGKLLGRHLSEEQKRKISEALKDRIISEEQKRKLSEVHKGKLFSVEHKRKLSEAHKGVLRKPFSEETRRKMSELHKGEKCNWWRGGIYKSTYSINWTESLKRTIRERDHYICQFCSAAQTEKVFDVHHIDYNKNNCNPNNLITLCRSCHIKTNQKREYWKVYYTK